MVLHLTLEQMKLVADMLRLFAKPGERSLYPITENLDVATADAADLAETLDMMIEAETDAEDA